MTSRSNVFRRHRRKTLLVVMVVLTIGMLFAVEAVLALNSPPSSRTYRAIRLRERRPNLDTQVEITDDMIRDPASLELGEVHLGTDDGGFIQPSGIHEEADWKIVFLGGSTTECLWVQEENRFPYLVGQLLEEAGAHGKVNSYSAGCAGNHSMHSNCALLGKVVPLRPDVAVMLHNANDLTILMHRETYWTTRRVTYDVIIQASRPNETVMSRAKDLAREMFPNLLELLAPSRTTDGLAPLRGTVADVDPEFIESNFRSSLLTFVSICKAWDIVPVLMTQANRLTDPLPEAFAHVGEGLRRDFGVEYSEFHRLYHRLNEVVREVGAAEGVLVVDLAREVPSNAEHLYDPYHLNNAGSVLVARLIAAKLADIR